MSSPAYSSSMALIISFGKFRCTNCAGVTYRCALFTEANMESWMGDIIWHVCLCVLWVGASASYSILMCWAANWGERLRFSRRAAVWGGTTLGGGTNVGCFTLGGGTNLGGFTVDYIKRVDSGAGVGVTQNGAYAESFGWGGGGGLVGFMGGLL